jgi:hypothetical protein
MNYYLKIRMSLRFAICVFILFTMMIYGCSGGHGYGQWGEDSKPKPKQHEVKYQDQHKHKHKHNGPPAHAPAHGYRAKYQYRYYPSHKVYHDSERGLYFYLKGENWEVGATLPSYFRTGLGESVTIELNIDKPYLYNSEHIKKYPPKKSKGKKNKKWAKKKK